jgi:hypothetical protein
VIHATFVDSQERIETSNTAEKAWEEAPCKEARGVGHVTPRGPEGLNEGNNLNTGLTGKERFEVTFPGKSAHFHLSQLETASCISIPGGHEFTGHGTGKFNHVKGYEVTFSIANKEGTIILHVQIGKEGTLLVDTGILTLTKGSKEKFA